MLEAVLLVAHLAGAPMSVDQAKTMADANEANLSKGQSSQLLQAQGNAFGSALATCSQPEKDLSAFTIVLSLNADGSVAGNWRIGETLLAKCVHSELQRSGLTGRWPAPFYTSIEFSPSVP